MDRREMLGESFRSISRVLPKFLGLGVLGGVERVMKFHDDLLAPMDVGGFPEGPPSPPAEDAGHPETLPS